MAKATRSAEAAKGWSPSPSPSPPLLSDQDTFGLLEQHAPPGLKPSTLPERADGKSPLLFVSPEDVERMNQQQAQVDENEGEQEELALWEEIANAVIWTIPFGFLFTGMDFAVHRQFHQPLLPGAEFYRLLNVVPTIFLVNFLTSRPRPLLPPLLLQVVLCGVCVATGTSLVHLTSTETYLKVMRQAPGMGVLWVWSVVRMDLTWAVLGLAGVAVAVKLRGDGAPGLW